MPAIQVKLFKMRKASLVKMILECKLPIENPEKYRVESLRQLAAQHLPTYIEDHFLRLVRRDILPRGYRVPGRDKKHIPNSNLEFDWSWVSKKVSVEIHGGLKNPRSGHRSEAGVKRDMRKSNLAQIHGWLHLQLTSEEVMDDYVWQTQTLPMLLKALSRGTSGGPST